VVSQPPFESLPRNRLRRLLECPGFNYWESRDNWYSCGGPLEDSAGYVVYPTLRPWSNRHVWREKTRSLEAETNSWVCSGPSNTSKLPPSVTRMEDILHIISFHSCYARLRLRDYPSFKLNTFKVGEGSENAEVGFVLLAVCPRMLLYFPSDHPRCRESGSASTIRRQFMRRIGSRLFQKHVWYI